MAGRAPQIIGLAVMPHFRFPQSLRTVEDLRHEQGSEISQEKVRHRRNRPSGKKRRTFLHAVPVAEIGAFCTDLMQF